MTDEQKRDAKGFIDLILRSSDVGDGWRNVSNMLRKLIDTHVARHPEFYETREMPGLQIRLKDEAITARKYL
jgi:hypothetical protein